MNEPLPVGVRSSGSGDADAAASAIYPIDCVNLAVADLAARDTLDQVDETLDQATQTLWDRCCHGPWKNNGVVTTYTDGGAAEGGQARVAPDPAREQLVLGYAPLDPDALDPDALDNLCGGGFIDAASSESLIGFARGDRPGGGGSSFVSSLAGVGDDGATIAGGGGSFGGGFGGGGAPFRVPEIDAMGGVIALAMLAALVALKRERR